MTVWDIFCRSNCHGKDTRYAQSIHRLVTCAQCHTVNRTTKDYKQHIAKETQTYMKKIYNVNILYRTYVLFLINACLCINVYVWIRIFVLLMCLLFISQGCMTLSHGRYIHCVLYVYCI